MRLVLIAVSLFTLIAIGVWVHGGWETTIKTKKLRRGTHSDFQCTGGSQNILWRLQKVPSSFPDANDARYRVCLLHDVCWVNRELVFYEDPYIARNAPEHFRAGSMKPMAMLGYLGGRFQPRIVPGLIPHHLPYDESATIHLFDGHSFADNIGHFLFDTVIPQFFALDMFGLSDLWNECRLTLLSDCKLVGNSMYWPKTTREYQCVKRYRDMIPIVFNSTYYPLLLERRDVCFKTVLVGQSSAFSLHSMELARAGFMRRFRDHILERIGGGGGPLTSTIVVPRRSSGFQGESIWPELCEAVKTWTRENNLTIAVVCFDPVAKTFAELVDISRRAIIVVAEHGTVSYTALWARNGAILISIGTDKELKEPQNLLFTTHIKTLYLSANHREELNGALAVSMRSIER